MATFLDRLISFCSHPRQSLEFRARRFALPYLAKWHRYRLSKKMDLGFLAQRPKHGFAPDFSDFWFLYQSVRRKRPRVILEFGSGSSTVVLAKALYDNNLERPGEKGYLHSIDDQRYWADVTRSIMPPFLSGVCEIHHIPTVEIEHEGIPCYRHSRLPDVVPDMIYLDGPSFTKQREDRGRHPGHGEQAAAGYPHHHRWARAEHRVSREIPDAAVSLQAPVLVQEHRRNPGFLGGLRGARSVPDPVLAQRPVHGQLPLAAADGAQLRREAGRWTGQNGRHRSHCRGLGK